MKKIEKRQFTLGEEIIQIFHQQEIIIIKYRNSYEMYNY